MRDTTQRLDGLLHPAPTQSSRNTGPRPAVVPVICRGWMADVGGRRLRLERAWWNFRNDTN